MSDHHDDCSYPEHLDLEAKVAELVQQVSDITSMWTEQCVRTKEATERVNQQTQLIRRMREVLRRLFVISPANHELGPFAKPYGEALTAAADMLEESREPPTAQVKMGADGSIDPRATFASTRYPDTTAQDPSLAPRLNYAHREMQTLMEENARYRKALDKIGGVCGYSEADSPLIRDVLNTAMNALESTQATYTIRQEDVEFVNEPGHMTTATLKPGYVSRSCSCTSGTCGLCVALKSSNGVEDES